MAGIRDVTPDLPLIPSRQRDADGNLRAIAHSATHNLVKACFARAGLRDDGRLGTHSLRKTFARKVYENSGHDLLVVKAALHHRSVQTTEKYLEANANLVQAAIAAGDFTRGGWGRDREFALVG